MIMNLFALQCAVVSDILNIGNSLEKAFMVMLGVLLSNILVLISILVLIF